jgi:hypothetical protein
MEEEVPLSQSADSSAVMIYIDVHFKLKMGFGANLWL